MNEFSILYGFLNISLVLLVSPLFMTVIKKVKARVQGRSGPQFLQGYYNLAKLFRKETLYSDYSSFISRIAPYASISILLGAAPGVEAGFSGRHCQANAHGATVMVWLSFSVLALRVVTKNVPPELIGGKASQW